MPTLKSLFKLDFFYVSVQNIETTFLANDKYEQYIVNIQDNNLVFSSKKLEPYSAWTSFFDAQQKNCEINLLYENMNNLFDLTSKLKNITEKKEDILTKYLSEYQMLIEYHPFFLMYYGTIHNVINALLKNDESTEFQIDTLLDLLTKLLNKYKELFNYVKNVLVEPFQHGLEHGTGICVARYERLLTKNMQYSPLFPKFQADNTNWDNELGDMVIETIFSKLDDIDSNISFKCKNDFDFSLEFSRGIEYFINNDYIFKQCPNCRGYFKTKRTLLVSYCNRIYRNNLTCQEISSKLKYKEKMNTHPIHVEYTKMYNRIYSRIRRNTILKENANLDKLKSLHENYYAEYEKSSLDSKEKILQEFIDAMNNLYI
jgi:hypothetical protein